MKKALLAALLATFAASWCLAQTDSLPAPTAEPCQSAPCAEPCQPANCNSPCQSGPCATPCCPAAVAEPFVPKWAVGASIQQLTEIPGAFFIERLFGKNILQIYLAANYHGEIQPDGKYFDDKLNDISVDLGMTGMKEMKGSCRFFKLYLGLNPYIFYNRYSRIIYSDRDSSYYDRYSVSYGAGLSTFVKTSFVKDMTIKSARFRNELAITPINGYVGIRYAMGHEEYYWSDDEYNDHKIYYGLDLISTEFITYSIKYLF